MLNISNQPAVLWVWVIAAIAMVALVVSRPRGRGRVDQVAAVSHRAVSWSRRAVLNQNEGLVYASACAVAQQLEPSWRVWLQVSLSEVVQIADRTEMDMEAYRWINSKRADFLVVDGTGWPLAVIGYQGRGHYRGNAAERDAVRRTVLSWAYVALPQASTL